MKTFTDNAGRTWTVAVNVDAIKRVRDLLGLDLLDTQAILERLMLDPILLCDVVYCVCKPQADAENVSDADFGRSMAGQTIRRAKEALIEDLLLFSPDPSDRQILGAAIQKLNQLAEKARAVIRARLDRMELPLEIEAALGTIGNSFTDSPEPSASTPDP